MMIKYAYDTERGHRKELNQDAVFAQCDGNTGLFAVCDGMGGHSDGARASRMITDAFAEWWESYTGDRSRAISGTPFYGVTGAITTPESLVFCLREANAHIFSTGAIRGITTGSTVAAVFVEGGHYFLISVGDSRVYRARAGEIKLLTRDHSWVFEQLENGILTESEADSHPMSGVLTQAVGGSENINPFMQTGRIHDGDYFFICSDGLYKSAPPADWFQDVMCPAQATQTAMQTAKLNQAADDFTLITIAIV